MRTIRVRYVTQIDAVDRVEVETEVIVENDDDAARSGAEALAVLTAVRRGIAEAAEES